MHLQRLITPEGVTLNSLPASMILIEYELQTANKLAMRHRIPIIVVSLISQST
jgi:hypothetical protein